MKNCALSVLAMSVALPSYGYQLEKVYDGLKVPWSVEFVSDSKAYVTERNGGILLIDLATKTHQSLPVPEHIYTSGQGGLLDLSLSPTVPQKLYLTYSSAKNGNSNNNGAATALAVFSPQQPQNGWTTLFTASMAGSGGRHFGSRLLVDEQHIYMTIGERGEREAAQQLFNHNGTIIRLDHNGKPPASNYFSEQALPEIFSYGHRNPQGIARDNDGHIWAIEHGPRGGDEVNKITLGSNYGWPEVSQGKEYWGPISVGDPTSPPGMQEPELVYTPSIAPGSLFFYSGDRYPNLDGKWLAGALKLMHVSVIKQVDGRLMEELRLFEELGERIRDISLSPNDYLYISTDSGNLYRVLPN
jgi:glucose/arabinose dehydrogenase